eukprot:TRINITY_DN74655_c0_g1_i1.p1 TRINITY_DN74655_c0_g1~~TRINITY_DN74655_c0_g1_i1.p1  ORF type:complete len:500 (+),score=77.60 TRINITY_DN74655_c0_g1_i1:74-1573(+)
MVLPYHSSVNVSALARAAAAAASGAAVFGGTGRPCAVPLLRFSLPTVLEELSFHSEPHLPAPWESLVDRLAKHWDRCRAAGGRLWEVQAAEAFLVVASGSLTLCAHQVCGQREVEELVWPEQLRRSTGRQVAGPAVALELAHWRQLHLDFVLAGFEKCGTSSLSHNLARHPQVEFVPVVDRNPHINTDNQEAQDGNFFWFVGNRLLPPAKLVEAFNRGECCKGGAMPSWDPGENAEEADESSVAVAKGSSSLADSALGQFQGPDGRDASIRRVIRGERNPVYAFHRFIMKAVSLIPSARVLLIACDPIGWLHSAYADTTNWHAGDPGDPPRPPLAAFATADMVPAPRPTSLSRGGWYNLSRRRALFALFLEGLMQLFGPAAEERLHVLHRDSVDQHAVGASGVRDAHDRIATFLGLENFSDGFVFERRNLQKRHHASDGASVGEAGKGPLLCAPQEAAAFSALKRYYRRDIRDFPGLLQRLGGTVPPRLASNRTLCDDL